MFIDAPSAKAVIDAMTVSSSRMPRTSKTSLRSVSRAKSRAAWSRRGRVDGSFDIPNEIAQKSAASFAVGGQTYARGPGPLNGSPDAGNWRTPRIHAPNAKVEVRSG